MSSVSPSSAATVSPGLATPAAPLGRGAKAAQDFEAQLLGSLLESMEKTFATLPGQSDMPGADDYNYLGSQALAQALAARGGFGIAAMITRHLPGKESGPETGHEGSGAGTAKVVANSSR
jgi:Rod binding domain-containing protein